MIGYFIDPFSQTVKAVAFHGHGTMNGYIDMGDGCDTTRVNKYGDCVLVDDLCYSRAEQKYFTFGDARWPLIAGKAFLFGCNQDGETCSVKASKEEVLTSVVWGKP